MRSTQGLTAAVQQLEAGVGLQSVLSLTATPGLACRWVRSRPGPTQGLSATVRTATWQSQVRPELYICIMPKPNKVLQYTNAPLLPVCLPPILSNPMRPPTPADANLVLGRILPDFFPHIFGPREDEPLDAEGARSADV